MKALSLNHVVLSDKHVESIKISDDSISPLELVLEITYRCNLRCIHCYANASQNSTIEMKYDDITRLFDALHKKGVPIIEITGGEPTVHRDFTKVLSYALDRFQLVTILTNGASITDEIIEYPKNIRRR